MKQIRDNPQQKQPKKQERGINENYARELMELHTLGVDGGYTQKDIIEVAKAFTGWTIADPTGYRKGRSRHDHRSRRTESLTAFSVCRELPDDLESGQFYFNDRWHEKGPKYVLGQK